MITLCAGKECSVKNTCLRYTSFRHTTERTSVINKCTNQKKYLQDSEQVVKGR